MSKRIPGFDVARAYSIFGMYVVNFNFCFGSFAGDTALGKFLNFFIGNSTSVFIILAGVGVSMMTHSGFLNPEERSNLRKKVIRRSWFLFALGLALFSWWPGDILHFYGGYMHFAAFLLFVPSRYLLLTALAVISVFHVLLFFIPVETGWQVGTAAYLDFWTIEGFLRNTLYNGWNSILPWFAYFLLGMWLGRLNWDESKVVRRIFLSGLIVFIAMEGLRFLAGMGIFNSKVSAYIMSEYFPPFLVFMLITASYALMVIAICVWLSRKFSSSWFIQSFAKTGQMTLSNYVIHSTIGMILLSWLTNKHYTGLIEDETPSTPLFILLFVIFFFTASVLFSVIWSKYFKKGPVEMLMRKLAG
jgi:uncharacterized protein